MSPPIMVRFELASRMRLSTIAVLALALSGCAGPGPQLGPVGPLRVEATSAGGSLRVYDMDGDGLEDFRERVAASGLIDQLEFLTSVASGDWELRGRDQGAFGSAGSAPRDLLVILDSVPYDMVQEAWALGRFRYLAPPSRLISTFPAMTDLALSEFFGVGPCAGMEARHYDGTRVTDGFREYLRMANAPWLDGVDYRLYPLAHSVGYLNPEEWFAHELARTQHYFRRHEQERAYVAYAVGTSGLGAQRGRDGHAAALAAVDRLCRRVIWETRGAARITLMSDHGHAFFRGQRVSLPAALRRLGYRVVARVSSARDVVLPEFGTVTCAALYAAAPALVARDLIAIEGVELAVYREAETVIVYGRGAVAKIERGGDRFRYTPQVGDPLRLLEIQAGLVARGAVDVQGFVSDADWRQATVDHRYPDALARLWRAFDGLMTHAPDVLISLADGYFSGADSISALIDLRAAHGNLDYAGSVGFVMTGAGPLSDALRIGDAREQLEKLGIRLPVIPGRSH